MATCEVCGKGIKFVMGYQTKDKYWTLCKDCYEKKKTEHTVKAFLRHKDCDGLFYYLNYGGEPTPLNDGWYCTLHDEYIGENYLLDRYAIYLKIDNILHDLHNSGVVHVSNGGEGDAIEEIVANKCHKEGNYTSMFIILNIIELLYGDYKDCYHQQDAMKFMEGLRDVSEEAWMIVHYRLREVFGDE